MKYWFKKNRTLRVAYETFAILAGNLAFFHPLHTDIDNDYMHHSHIHLDTVPHTKVEFWSLLKRRWWTNDLDFTELGGSPWKFISQPTRVLQHGKWKQWFKCAGVQPRPSAKRNLLLSNSTIAITSNVNLWRNWKNCTYTLIQISW